MLSAQTLHRLFIKDSTTGKIRFSKTGIETLGPKFAKIGVDIRSVTTLAEARRAVEEYSNYALRGLALNSTCPEIDAIFASLPAYADGLSIRNETK